MKYKKRRLFQIKKKHLKIIVSVLAAIIIIIILLLITSANKTAFEKSQVVASMQKVGIINVGLRGDLGPLCTYNEDTGVYEGLEKDISDELIRRVFGEDIIINNVGVNSQTKDAFLISGKLDLSLGASINIDASGIYYSSPYYTDGTAFLVMDGKMTNQQGLNGGSVAVIQGSLAQSKSETDSKKTRLEIYLQEQNIDASVQVYASYPEAVDALEAGFVNGVCADEASLMLYGKAGMVVLNERFLPNSLCIQVRENLGALGDVINDAVEEMQADGTLDALAEKWNLAEYAIQ